MKVLDYQWNEKLVPYWKEAAAIAKRAGVKVAIEMHPASAFTIRKPCCA